MNGNETEDTLNSPINRYYLFLLTIPAVTIFGNGFVIIAILTQKSLKTNTNYLLLSLATADLMIGVLVMPFSIYVLIVNMRWTLSWIFCDIYIVADVSCSTSSIVHLVAISVDRYFAVIHHLKYRSASQRRRRYITIGVAWIFSFGLGCPLGIGLNERNQKFCGITNMNFVLYGSIFSFYVPCITMIVLYSIIYYRLYKLRVLKTQSAITKTTPMNSIRRLFRNAYGDAKRLPGLHSSAVSIATSASYTVTSSPENLSQAEGTTTEPVLSSETKSRSVKFSIADTGNRPRSSTVTRAKKTAGGAIKKIKSLRFKRSEVIAAKKEARATKLVATVMGIFLICWLPFFTVNLIFWYKLTYRPGSWTDEWETIFAFCTWLGYFNSCLNPIIYGLVNAKFREAFLRLLCCNNLPASFAQMHDAVSNTWRFSTAVKDQIGTQSPIQSNMLKSVTNTEANRKISETRPPVMTAVTRARRQTIIVAL